MSSTAKSQPQQHLLPKQQNSRIGSVNNELDTKKRKYIIEMRKAMSDQDIIVPDGSLNLKYFNVKKGQYWSKVENEKLIKAVIKHGATSFKEIKKEEFKNWSDTEIRLRICRLLKYYNLKDYEGRKFTSAEEIFKEAEKNKANAKIENKVVGGIYYNPPQEADDGILNSFFNANTKKKQ